MHDKTNAKWPVHPVKTQISLGIHPVWSESSLFAWRKIGSLVSHWVHREDSDQTVRSLRWVHVILLVLSCCSSFYKISRNMANITKWRVPRADYDQTANPCSFDRVPPATLWVTTYPKLPQADSKYWLNQADAQADLNYCKIPKYSTTWNICCNPPKVRTKWLYHRVMCPKDADGMENSADPDQTAPLLRPVCPKI